MERGAKIADAPNLFPTRVLMRMYGHVNHLLVFAVMNVVGVSDGGTSACISS